MDKYYRNRQLGTIERRPFRSSYSRLTPTETQSDGVLKYSCVYSEFDFSKEISKYNAADFSLGNLIHIGAFGSQSYVSMSLNSDLNFVDEFTKNYNDNVSTTEG